jgi:hypothetical protein
VSLVSEALRKARQEAVARGRIQRSHVFQSAQESSTRRSRLGLGVVLGGSLTLAAALLGAAVAWWALGRHAPSSPAPTSPALPAPAATASEPARVAAPLAVPAQRTPAAANRRTVEDLFHESALAHPVTPQQAAAVATPEPPGARPGGTQPAPVEPIRGDAGVESSAQSSVQSYVLKANLGRVTLNLDYLVFKPSAPFGRVNGQDVVPGSIVEGFRVEEIGPDFMRLKDSRTTVILRLH